MKRILSVGLCLCILILFVFLQGCGTDDPSIPESKELSGSESQTLSGPESQEDPSLPDNQSEDSSGAISEDPQQIPGDAGPFGSGGYIQGRYLVNAFRPGAPLSDLAPLLQIDLEDGTAQILCPDPKCTHDERSPDCPYHYMFTINFVCEGGGYVFFCAFESHGSVNRLYVFNREQNTLKALRPINLAGLYAAYGDGKFFFTEKCAFDEIEMLRITDGNTIKVIMLDPATGLETVIGRISQEESIFEYSGGFLITRTNYSQYFSRIDVHEPYTKTRVLTPDGKEEFSFTDYMYVSGNLAVKYSSPSAVYVYDDARFLKLPVDCRITAVQRVGETVVFQTVTSDSKYAKSGLDKDGNEATAYLCDPVIYLVQEDGTYEAFEIESDYLFVVSAVYGHKIFARSETRVEDGELLTDSERYLLIDLDTGKTKIYGLDDYNANGNKAEITIQNLSWPVHRLH